MRAIVEYLASGKRRSDRGATSTEYALLVGFLVLAMIAGATLFGAGLSQVFTDLGNTLSTMDDNF